jgi:hypothetical protein
MRHGGVLGIADSNNQWIFEGKQTGGLFDFLQKSIAPAQQNYTRFREKVHIHGKRNAKVDETRRYFRDKAVLKSEKIAVQRADIVEFS